MDQEKFGKIIKDLRKRNNLTQKDLADKYNVTYQAVSKWENGINLPDISLIKKICEDYDINIEKILDVKTKSNKKVLYIIILVLSLLIIGTSIYLLFHKHSFEFKTLSTTCSNFKITGSISYNETKSAIYISNVDYCGGDDNEKYKEIECTLYEKNNDIKKVISKCNYKNNKNIALEEYLKDVSIGIDNYSKVCKTFNEDTLFLEIIALDKNDKQITYTVPLKLNDACKKDDNN